MSLLKLATSAIAIALVLCLALNLYVYAVQSSLMYFPAVERVQPEQVGLHDVEVVALRTEPGVELSSWYGRAAEGKPTILFFHGNGGAIQHRNHRFRNLMELGYGVFLLGYPGYGDNPGNPGEKPFLKAADSAYAYLRDNDVMPDDIVIYGESIGSGVAVQLAAHVEASGLILEAPLTSAVDVARHHYPYILVDLLLTDTFRSIDYIDSIQMPLLVIHGDKDQVIPIRFGRELYDKASDPKQFVAIPGAGHNDLSAYSTDSVVDAFISAL